MKIKTLDDEGGRLECLTSSASLNSEKQVTMLATARRRPPRRSRISWQNTAGVVALMRVIMI